MILDTLPNLERYAAMHPAFAKVIAYLAAHDLRAMEPGKYELDGKKVFLSIDARDGKSREGTRLETHRNYLDIQITLEGAEEIGWKAAAACEQPQADYNPEKDIQFFSDAPEAWFAVAPGHFAIFFPEDAHAPLAGAGKIRKAIVKVSVEG